MLGLKTDLPHMAILSRVLVYKIGQSDPLTIDGSFAITMENHREILVGTICHFPGVGTIYLDEIFESISSNFTTFIAIITLFCRWFDQS